MWINCCLRETQLLNVRQRAAGLSHRVFIRPPLLQTAGQKWNCETDACELETETKRLKGGKEEMTSTELQSSVPVGTNGRFISTASLEISSLVQLKQLLNIKILGVRLMHCLVWSTNKKCFDLTISKLTHFPIKTDIYTCLCVWREMINL